MAIREMKDKVRRSSDGSYTGQSRERAATNTSSYGRLEKNRKALL
jgi:hypothetical protein